MTILEKIDQALIETAILKIETASLKRRLEYFALQVKITHQGAPKKNMVYEKV